MPRIIVGACLLNTSKCFTSITYGICGGHLRCIAFLEYNSIRLTHWGRVTHVCVSKPTTIDSDNGLAPGRRQAIIWTNAGILLIGPLGTNPSEILSEIYTFSLKKMHLKKSSGKWRPFCLGLNVLTVTYITDNFGKQNSDTLEVSCSVSHIRLRVGMDSVFIINDILSSNWLMLDKYRCRWCYHSWICSLIYLFTRKIQIYIYIHIGNIEFAPSYDRSRKT